MKRSEKIICLIIFSAVAVGADFVNRTGQCPTNLKVDPKAALKVLRGPFDGALTTSQGPLERTDFYYKIYNKNDTTSIFLEYYKKLGSSKQEHLRTYIYKTNVTGRFNFLRQNTANSPIYTAYTGGVLHLGLDIIVAYLCRNIDSKTKEDEIVVAALTERISPHQIHHARDILRAADIDDSYLQLVPWPCCTIEIGRCLRNGINKIESILGK